MALWRARVLAFLTAALVGLLVPSGCIVAPEGGSPSRESIESFFCGPDHACGHNGCEASCGTPSDDCCAETCTADCADTPCPPGHGKSWLHWPKCHLYDPEAGIFNFCIPPQCINPPPPLPPGRFFPVPVKPAFAQRGDAGYDLLMGAGASGSGLGNGGAPCQ